MNKIIMDKTLETPVEEQENMIPPKLNLPDKPPMKVAPYYGMVPIPQHDFPERFSNFCFKSLYIKEEAIRAMVEIRTECNQLLKENKIFFTAETLNNCRVDEFRQKQAQSIATIGHQTGEQGWVGKLSKIIKVSFEDVGKGWFNIKEDSKETYEFGKLKKFLTLVNFMMQDTVLTMSRESVKEFVDFILKFCPKETRIVNTNEVYNTFDKAHIFPDDSDYEEMPH
jgi:dynein heavy chain